MPTSKATWACFDCRSAVRRERVPMPAPVCSSCGRPLRNLGHRIRIPRRSDAAGWRLLIGWIRGRAHAEAQQAEVERVRDRHRLETRIRDFEARPSNAGRDRAIRDLRRRLDPG